jgi:hypothetical protein
MVDKRLEAAAAEKEMFFDETWRAAVTFESAYSRSDKDDWYSEARIVRGGFAMSQLSSEFLEEYVSFVLNNVPLRGTAKRRKQKANEIKEMFSQQRATIKNSVATWTERARALDLTLPEKRANSKIALYADAELRDLVRHLEVGSLSRTDFETKIEEVTTQFKMTLEELSEWKDSQAISF